MTRYNPSEIEPKWQKKWEEDGVYSVDFNSGKQKFVGFGMFNYPSGAGIHVGHVRNFTIPDVITRVKRQQGFESYQPVGWDSFGLPAENYAIKTGVSPQESTKSAIKKYHDQYRAMGWAVDWQKEINTTDPEYYKWTQWCFVKLFENGLAYQKESAQWWCEHDKTVLADEQVEGGTCWRCGNPVVKKSLKQWFFKITEYADEMLEATDELDWTEAVKASQKSWIGKSIGAEIEFGLDFHDETVNSRTDEQGKKAHITVFTTRPDTIYGATYLVLAPDHIWVTLALGHKTVLSNNDEVEQYVKQAVKKSELERQMDVKEKTGIKLEGVEAVNPATGENIPIFVADYVLAGYGTGAIMAVPAHDQRDNEFAKKFNLPIKNVVNPVAVREDAKDKTTDLKKKKIVAVVTNEKNELLTINWGEQFGGRLFIGGTMEDSDSSAEVTALREVTEETGYNDLEVEAIGEESFFYKYYAFSKQETHEIETTFVKLKLKSDSKQDQNLDDTEKDKFKVEWISLEKAEQEIIEPLHRYGYEKFIKEQCYHGEGVLTNSGTYNGMKSEEAREKIVADLAKNNVAQEKVNFKMRDWLISRQRYWGAPIPIIHCEKDGPVAVPENELPVVLPDVENYLPTGENTSVLAGATDWVNTKCPKCGGSATRETDTMDGYVCSSWYFLRYLDPTNQTQAWNPEIAKKWMPIDFYNGADHATAHLLYARFFARFFHGLGLVGTPEPFKKMVFNGKIKAGDGSAFSKSKGNGIDPLEVIAQGYGADAMRLYEMFAAPVELDVLWDQQGIPGSHRFLSRVWILTQEFIKAEESESNDETTQSLNTAIHKAIKKVTEDLEENRFNTAIAALMEATNNLYKLKDAQTVQKNDTWQSALESLLQLLAPFAPHMCEELWQQLGHQDSIHVDHWPKWNNKYLVSDTMNIAVQVNGKLRATIEVAADSNEEQIVEAAKNNEKVAAYLSDNSVKKTIYVPQKLVNFVV